MKLLKRFLPIIIVLLLSYWSIKPFLVHGFFPIHDDTQVQRVFEMHKSLSDGMFPVRWVSDLGYNYGYPIFNFYAPFAYYVGGLFMFFGLDALMATKAMMILGIGLAGLFMYLFAKEFWGTGGGLVSAVLYLYAPYHALDIYVRGDVAEFWAYAFIPIVFYGIWKSYKNSNWVYVIFGSLGYSGVIMSHNLTAMMITPFVLLFILLLYIFSYTKKKSYKSYYPFLTLLIGIMVASFYWIPVFAEMKYTNVLSQVGGGADYKDHFICLPQLWDSPWGFGGSTPTRIDGLSFKVGKLHILLFLVSFIFVFSLRKKEKLKFWVSIFSIFCVLLSVFLTLNYSKFIWDTFSPMAFFQYPWRFLLVITFFTSFIGGLAGWLLITIGKKNLLTNFLIISLIAVVVFFNLELFNPQTISYKTANDYTNDYNLHWTASKISDEYLPKDFLKPKNPDEVPDKKIVSSNLTNLQIISLTEKTNIIRAEVLAKNDQSVIINLAYFPSWRVFVDGKQTKIENSNRGFVVDVAPGKHIIDIKFIQTPVEKFANAFSLIGIFIIIVGVIIFQRKK